MRGRWTVGEREVEEEEKGGKKSGRMTQGEGKIRGTGEEDVGEEDETKGGKD